MTSTLELSRIVKTKGLPAEPVLVEADASEREALAVRFGLPGIDSLNARIDLEARGSAIRATGFMAAAIRQSCAISGEDFPANIEEALDLRFVPAENCPVVGDANSEIEIELDAQDCDEIEFHGDSFDLGEAVAQTLGLSIDPYAEGPNANAARKASGIVQEGEQDGPLAEALSALRKK